jgi:hypothetical protein
MTMDQHAIDDDEEHGHDDHGHDEEPLGPIDAWAWGAGALGILAGLAVALAFFVATRPPGG